MVSRGISWKIVDSCGAGVFFGPPLGHHNSVSRRNVHLGFRPVLEILNTDPLISDSNRDLGDKNSNFTIECTVDDADSGDVLTATESFAPTRKLKNSISVPVDELSFGKHMVKVVITDGKGGTAYRRVTLKRTNFALSISRKDTDLGLQAGSFAEEHIVTEFVDDKQIRSYQATLGQTETIELSRAEWLTLTNGAHQLRVEAVDGNFATSVRVWNFFKDEKIIEFQLVAPEETDQRASKILIMPTWKTEGSTVLMEACNNAFDEVPTWEDIMAMVFLNRVYSFTNTTKTADKWGVNVRFKLVKNEGHDGEVSVSGFGGASG